MTAVTIVCGAPGSGKTSWVTKQMHWGDMLLDIDRMFEAISLQAGYQKPITLLPVILAMRDAALAQLSKPNQVQRAFIITTTTKQTEIDAVVRRFKARVVVLETPSMVCMQRISSDPRRSEHLDQWQKLVDKWFRDWRAYPGAEVVQ